jgi:putative transcription factor
MLCEMCGKEVASTSRVRLERTVLALCPECARFGTPIDPPPSPVGEVVPGPGPARGRASPVVTATRPAGRTRRLEERDLYQEIGELELAADWGHKVRVAREALAWTPEELGKRLNEKKSVVLKIESGTLHPPDELVRKLEHLLKVRLRASPESSTTA